VVKYVPEFGTNGKEAVIVEQLFTHAGGFPNALMRSASGSIARPGYGVSRTGGSNLLRERNSPITPPQPIG
jgi:hypothetical protein